MAEQVKGFLIGPGLHSKIRQTIARVEGTPIGTGVSRIPTEVSGGDGGGGGGNVKLAAFTGTMSWIQMQARQIYFMESDTNASSVLPVKISEKTTTCVASMFSIPGVTSTQSMATALVTVAKMNGVWHVISAAGGG